MKLISASPALTALRQGFSAPIGWRDHVVGGALAVAYLAWLLATAGSLGFTRDETFYFQAATQYAGWWRMLVERGSDALQRGAIDPGLELQSRAPRPDEVALRHLRVPLLHQKWRLLSEASTGFRLPGMVCGAVAVGRRTCSARAPGIGARACSRDPLRADASRLLSRAPRVL